MSDYFLGEIRNFAFGKAPNGWVPCDGRTLPVQQYTALFSLLGVTFGGNGITSFNLPDLRGRVPYGIAPTLLQGTAAGAESVTLSNAQLPPHTHAIAANATPDSTPIDVGNFLSVNQQGANPAAVPFKVYAAYSAGNITPLANTSVTPAGSSGPHENRQPTLTTSFCISISGIYPSRG